jgi:hypothetical protein
MQKYVTNAMIKTNDATFCFLVTQDLTKEHIWREWFEGLERLQFKFAIVVHCSASHKNKVKSDWLKRHFLPDEHMRDTEWGWIVSALMSMHEYAIAMHPAAWYSSHTETCVPMVSPEKFIDVFNKHKQNSFVSYCKAWWNPLKVKRANLHLLSPEMHLAHSSWCIFCHEDLHQIVNLPKTDERIKHVLNTVILGHVADESYAAIMLLVINNLKNVINEPTTLVDWKRTPNGNNPHTFISWTVEDETIVRNIRRNSKNNYMFMRKVGPTFPDHILRRHIFNESP